MGPADIEVRADGRQQQVHQLRVAEHFVWRSVQLPEPFDELVIVQSGRRKVGVGHLGGAAAGHEQVERLWQSLPLEVTRHLERQQRAHAVTEEREWAIEKWWKDLGQHTQSVVEPRERRFPHPVPASRQLHRANIDRRRYEIRPACER